MHKFQGNSNRIIGLILILLIFAFHFACKQREETGHREDISNETPSPQTKEKNTSPSESISPEKKLVAKVNGRPIYEEDLKGKKLEYVIVDEILYEEGLRQGLGDVYKDQNDKLNKNLIIRAMKIKIQGDLPRNQRISDREIEDFYKEYQRKYTMLRAIGISATDKNTAEIIRERAIKGEELEKIASEYPDSGVRLSPNPVSLSLDKNDYFQELKDGEISDIIQDRGKFLIYKVIQVQKLPIGQLKNSIKASIFAKKLSHAYSDFAEKAKKEHKIDVQIFQEDR
jgi:hypothetical protein